MDLKLGSTIASLCFLDFVLSNIFSFILFLLMLLVEKYVNVFLTFIGFCLSACAFSLPLWSQIQVSYPDNTKEIVSLGVWGMCYQGSNDPSYCVLYFGSKSFCSKEENNLLIETCTKLGKSTLVFSILQPIFGLFMFLLTIITSFIYNRKILLNLRRLNGVLAVYSGAVVSMTWMLQGRWFSPNMKDMPWLSYEQRATKDSFYDSFGASYYLNFLGNMCFLFALLRSFNRKFEYFYHPLNINIPETLLCFSACFLSILVLLLPYWIVLQREVILSDTIKHIETFEVYGIWGQGHFYKDKIEYFSTYYGYRSICNVQLQPTQSYEFIDIICNATGKALFAFCIFQVVSSFLMIFLNIFGSLYRKKSIANLGKIGGVFASLSSFIATILCLLQYFKFVRFLPSVIDIYRSDKNVSYIDKGASLHVCFYGNAVAGFLHLLCVIVLHKNKSAEFKGYTLDEMNYISADKETRN